jgi:hypothetical protein
MSKKPGKRLIIHSNAHRDRAPTRSTPPTRLVSKWEYLATVVVGGFFGLLGVLSISVAIISSFILLCMCGIPFLGELSEDFSNIAGGSFVLSLGAFCVCLPLFMRVQKMETVAPATRHNIGDLPDVETLGRASDLPPSQQQAELLRAAKSSQETPPEELLRATTGSPLDG